jgi:Fe-S-cluster-containing dehydrogenase component
MRFTFHELRFMNCVAKEETRMDRRSFLMTLGIAGGSALAGKTLRAEEAAGDKEFMGVLVDTTRCVGCRTCEVACAEAHGLPAPDLDDESVFERERQPTETQWTVVNYYKTEVGDISVKKQCMHCNQPACAAACLVKAMLKTEDGPVIWREDRCMGCRFCMLSCPFDIPKFEYNSAVPKIQKCTMCWERLKEGQQPACVENCPAEALLFGRRKDLLEIARNRIYENPNSYVHHIYGEHEAGGTGVLYLSSVPFEQLGFRTDLESAPYPELTKDFLYGVPVVLLLWPSFLLALSNATKKEEMESEA